MLAGAGAEEFASEPRLFLRAAELFFHRRALAATGANSQREMTPDYSGHTISHVGTVGAVALDSLGHLAAATSTGGMTGKRYQRIGDSPIIGAGTYADDRSCAVSATGHGEVFIRARRGSRYLRANALRRPQCGSAVREVIFGELPALGGEGGVIAIDAHGEIAMEFNSEGMFRASRKAGEETRIAIYR